jgi:hypothetical protein
MLPLPHTTTVNSMYNLGHRSNNEEIWCHTVLLHLQFATRLVNTVLTAYDTICVWTIYSYIWVSHSGSPRPFYSSRFKRPNNLAKKIHIPGQMSSFRSAAITSCFNAFQQHCQMHYEQVKYFTISRASVTSFNINLQATKWYVFQRHTVSSKFIYLLFNGVWL